MRAALVVPALMVALAVTSLPVAAASGPASETGPRAAAQKACGATVARSRWWRSVRAHGWFRRRAWAPVARRRCAPRSAAPVDPSVDSPASAPAPAAPQPGPQLGRSVQVRAKEYSLALSRSLVAAGNVNVEFNTVYAEDPHDLRLRGPNGTERPLFGETAPELVPPPRQAFPIAAGDYVLFCAIPGHEALGMSAPLSVR